jgi:hypothetical protein
MEEEEEGGIASPTNTEVSQATAYNSVYMAWVPSACVRVRRCDECILYPNMDIVQYV